MTKFYEVQTSYGGLIRLSLDKSQVVLGVTDARSRHRTTEYLTSVGARYLRDALNDILGDQPDAEYEVTYEMTATPGHLMTDYGVTQKQAEAYHDNPAYTNVTVYRITKEEV